MMSLRYHPIAIIHNTSNPPSYSTSSSLLLSYKSSLVGANRIRNRSNASKTQQNKLVVRASSESLGSKWEDMKLKASNIPCLSDIIWPSAGAFAVMAMLGRLYQMVASRGLNFTIAPLGAVCAVLFSAPNSPAAQAPLILQDASTYWNQQPLAAREYACQTIIPSCTTVADISTKSKDLIEREFSAFSQSLDNNLYMLPSTPQALIEAMGTNASTGAEALAAAEKSAAMLTSRAGARDPSAIPSICRISNALQNPAGVERSDTALASVLGALEFCLKPRGSEASVLEDLSKAINLVHTKRNLVNNCRVLLSHAQYVQQDYDRMVNYCLKVAAEQETVVNERWLP